MIPVLLITGCLALGVNILNTRKMNKSLVEKIERARSDMKVAMDTSQDCTKQLEMKSSDQTAHEQKLTSLTVEVDNLTNERNKIQEELIELQEQMDGDKNAVDAENAKINDKLINELAQAEEAKPPANKNRE